MNNWEWTIRIHVTYWCNSTTILTCLKSNKKCEVFTKNRVEEIRQLTKVQDWRHVAGENNPADLPSRGCSIRQF